VFFISFPEFFLVAMLFVVARLFAGRSLGSVDEGYCPAVLCHCHFEWLTHDRHGVGSALSPTHDVNTRSRIREVFGISQVAIASLTYICTRLAG
jgi:hypothetical protein